MPLVLVFGCFCSEFLRVSGRQISVYQIAMFFCSMKGRKAIWPLFVKKVATIFSPMANFSWQCFILKQPNWRLNFILWITLVNPCFVFCNNFIKTFGGARMESYQHFFAQWHYYLLYSLVSSCSTHLLQSFFTFKFSCSN